MPRTLSGTHRYADTSISGIQNRVSFILLSYVTHGLAIRSLLAAGLKAPCSLSGDMKTIHELADASALNDKPSRCYCSFVGRQDQILTIDYSLDGYLVDDAV